MLRALALTVVAFALLTASAVARTVDVPARLGAEIPDAASIDVPVLLPSRVDLDIASSTKTYPEGDSKKGEYHLALSGAKDCGGANACFLATFTGERGAKLGYKATNVKLALGMKGHYRPLSCGASCSPPSIAWIQKGVRYEIQAKARGGREAFVAMANSAIKNGNRG
ncbi:hypothetical protein DSM104299_03311 [Baekduia alba]|uniref:hypothetical protein n=1 Tax=Baekduia alba TaxID=2997333 RepID=UPI00233FD3A3|nr:hypothetical protein [Baekduia alba]WCB94574.1 hypothetical protein DSM104299_03311 [Baekduia alba]